MKMNFRFSHACFFASLLLHCLVVVASQAQYRPGGQPQPQQQIPPPQDPRQPQQPPQDPRQPQQPPHDPRQQQAPPQDPRQQQPFPPQDPRQQQPPPSDPSQQQQPPQDPRQQQPPPQDPRQPQQPPPQDPRQPQPPYEDPRQPQQPPPQDPRQQHLPPQDPRQQQPFPPQDPRLQQTPPEDPRQQQPPPQDPRQQQPPPQDPRQQQPPSQDPRHQQPPPQDPRIQQQPLPKVDDYRPQQPPQPQPQLKPQIVEIKPQQPQQPAPIENSRPPLPDTKEIRIPNEDKLAQQIHKIMEESVKSYPPLPPPTPLAVNRQSPPSPPKHDSNPPKPPPIKIEPPPQPQPRPVKPTPPPSPKPPPQSIPHPPNKPAETKSPLSPEQEDFLVEKVHSILVDSVMSHQAANPPPPQPPVKAKDRPNVEAQKPTTPKTKPTPPKPKSTTPKSKPTTRKSKPTTRKSKPSTPKTKKTTVKPKTTTPKPKPTTTTPKPNPPPQTLPRPAEINSPLSPEKEDFLVKKVHSILVDSVNSHQAANPLPLPPLHPPKEPVVFQNQPPEVVHLPLLPHPLIKNQPPPVVHLQPEPPPPLKVQMQPIEQLPPLQIHPASKTLVTSHQQSNPNLPVITNPHRPHHKVPEPEPVVPYNPDTGPEDPFPIYADNHLEKEAEAEKFSREYIPSPPKVHSISEQPPPFQPLQIESAPKFSPSGQQSNLPVIINSPHRIHHKIPEPEPVVPYNPDTGPEDPFPIYADNHLEKEVEAEKYPREFIPSLPKVHTMEQSLQIESAPKLPPSEQQSNLPVITNSHRPHHKIPEPEPFLPYNPDTGPEDPFPIYADNHLEKELEADKYYDYPDNNVLPQHHPETVNVHDNDDETEPFYVEQPPQNNFNNDPPLLEYEAHLRPHVPIQEEAFQQLPRSQWSNSPPANSHQQPNRGKAPSFEDQGRRDRNFDEDNYSDSDYNSSSPLSNSLWPVPLLILIFYR